MDAKGKNHSHGTVMNNAQAEAKKRGLSAVTSFLGRHAFVITMMLNTMVESLARSVRGQFTYRYFHAQFEDELSLYNVSSGCGEELKPAVQAIENRISQTTERWRMYSDYVMFFPLMVGALVLGMKSDQIGRRFVFVFTTLITAIDQIVFAIVIKFELHFAYTFIGLFIWSLFAGDIGMVFAAYALISDTHGKKDAHDAQDDKDKVHDKDLEEVKDAENQVNDKENSNHKGESTTDNDTADDDLDMSREKSRTFKIVIIDILRLLSRSVIQFVTGYIIEYAGFFYTLIIVISFKVAIFAFAFVFVEETGKQNKALTFLGSLKKILFALKDPKKRTTLLLVNLGLMLAFFSFVDEYGVLRTYQMSPPFCFTAIQLGWFNGVDYFKTVLNIPLLPVMRRVGFSDSSIASLGMLTAGTAALLIALIRETWVFFAATVMAAPGDLSLSMSRVITSRVVGRGALASTMALVLSMQFVAWFVSSQTSSYLYQFTLDTVPTAPFFMATGFFCLAAALYGAESCHQRRSSTSVPDESGTEKGGRVAEMTTHM